MSIFPVIDLEATGANILRLRKQKGLSVKDLQAYFGFECPQAIYKWQWGHSLPSVDNLFALSKLLNTSIDEILVEGTCHQDLLFCFNCNYSILCSLKLKTTIICPICYFLW